MSLRGDAIRLYLLYVVLVCGLSLVVEEHVGTIHSSPGSCQWLHACFIGLDLCRCVAGLKATVQVVLGLALTVIFVHSRSP